MAVLVMTNKPGKLWTMVKEAMKERAVRTWELYTDELYFTHLASQWNKKAWLCLRLATVC
jgi:hypothetical protein